MGIYWRINTSVKTIEELRWPTDYRIQPGRDGVRTELNDYYRNPGTWKVISHIDNLMILQDERSAESYLTVVEL